MYQRHSSRYGLGETFYTGSPLALSQQTSGANDASTDTSTPSRPAGALPSHEPTRNHFSWSDATRLLVFGDSVTATTFDPTLEQPSQSNPFGNPIFPNNRPNGPTWADYLTLTHNQSQVLTYNFAQGGSTVDNKVQSSLWASPSAVDQTSLFISTYATTGKLDEWDLGTTLAIFRFGVNDCMIEYIFPDHILDVSSDVAQYAKIVEELYSVGLRNFLFLNVGPADVNFNRTGGEVGKLMRLATNIANWNSELAKMKMDLMAKHEGMNALVFDTHSFFLWLEDHPKSVEVSQRFSRFLLSSCKCRRVSCERHKTRGQPLFIARAS